MSKRLNFISIKILTLALSIVFVSCKNLVDIDIHKKTSTPSIKLSSIVSDTTSTTPITVQIESDSACAIDDQDDLYCWGDGAGYRLGLGTTTDCNSPQQVMVGTKFERVVVGTAQGCAKVQNGSIKCWGQSRFGSGLADDNMYSARGLPIDISSWFDL